MKFTNLILVILIILALAAFGFFGWQARQSQTAPAGPGAGVKTEKFTPIPVVNRGKASEEQDAALEADVRTVNDAVRAYAKDHAGKYPESDVRNPCSGVHACLKSVNINTVKKVYLDPIPQMAPGNADYHYQADNVKKTYCVAAPVALETASTMLFECTQTACGRVPFAERCSQ
ncbi:hypothetical protein A3C91_01670 [Candidatus Azambacteria bacterium RIFCSPHIGHO2_02_FULL_52_12]|uniref:Uncharacterized protein n=1 Tax=Candidatus Azambacteria bacterium RIFCSPLOWO2_01_FULL_46_25 TaxID=1797298 RepID=A0A1F5BVB5_9BACT|nr:MAG: hypothetical protein A3C91_01670 [Candidatus Azambacteria bacterium RIFCSPHIGHO2_02_FULL_52_12]OGD34554.1 MAG: hypothetical protein A2988_03530 [Candidatus Azambacteria bacterium RIFCSPLOWO2_01_FULL_46_25]OGD36428.1 MAG: hypothetical protein A2850_02030 [Candidatus Azambacteria bacterium RIFCSPHIGHO2_01_FULL_51_74]